MRKGAPAAKNAQTKNANTTIGLGDSKRLKLAKIMASQQYQERQWYCIARLCMEQQARLFFAPYALLADAMRRPRTSADIAPMTPMLSRMASLESELR